jgi:hypothetical protein
VYANAKRDYREIHISLTSPQASTMHHYPKLLEEII